MSMKPVTSNVSLSGGVDTVAVSPEKDRKTGRPCHVVTPMTWFFLGIGTIPDGAEPQR
jgi:hypothetical protein